MKPTDIELLPGRASTACMVPQHGAPRGGCYKRRVTCSKGEFFSRLRRHRGTFVVLGEKRGGAIRQTPQDVTLPHRYHTPIEAVFRHSNPGLNELFRRAVEAASDGKMGDTRRRMLRVLGLEEPNE